MATSAELAAQLAEHDRNKIDSATALNEALKQFGVPEIRDNVAKLRTTVANTTSALNNVDPSVTGRTSQSLVTEAQRQRIVNNERAPIAGQLSEQTGALGEQDQTLRDATQQASTIATNRVNDYVTGRQALQSQYDDTYKREQDEAAKELARQQAAEESRRFDIQQATTRGSSSYGGGSAKADKPITKNDVAMNVAAQFQKNIGKDGKVGNNTWAAALNDWRMSGGSIREFWQRYGNFVNLKFKSSYAGYAQR